MNPQVENPIPFAAEFATRARSIAHLHARYAGLLLFPLRLSADWSYPCIPLLESWSDPRNVLSVLLYVFLSWCVLVARPWGWLMHLARFRELWRKGSMPSVFSSPPRELAVVARWRLFVVIALVVVPFCPASNMFFYVGTFIGERLLYMPSVGYCILLSGVGHRFAEWLLASTSRFGRQRCTHPPSAMCIVKVACVVLMPVLVCFGVKTMVRNADWRDEEALFRAAQQVCPNSAKVQLNNGIMERRLGNLMDALTHFR